MSIVIRSICGTNELPIWSTLYGRLIYCMKQDRASAQGRGTPPPPGWSVLQLFCNITGKSGFILYYEIPQMLRIMIDLTGPIISVYWIISKSILQILFLGTVSLCRLYVSIRISNVLAFIQLVMGWWQISAVPWQPRGGGGSPWNLE